MNPTEANVSGEQVVGWADTITQFAVQYGLLLVYALAILLVARWVAKRARAAVRAKILKNPGLDAAIADFLSSIVHWVVLLIAGIAVLQLFGIDSTSLVAVLGAASLAVGLALQGTLSNFAAGVMLLIFRPFGIGDYVDVSGHSGTVKKIDIFVTELATVDNVQIIIPNSEVWSKAIVNYSAYDRRRVDLTIGIDYGASHEEAVEIIKSLVAKDPRVSGEPETFVKVTNLGDSSVDITVRAWCQAPDYWDVKFDLTKGIKNALDGAGISIPYPHIEVVRKDAATA